MGADTGGVAMPGGAARRVSKSLSIADEVVAHVAPPAPPTEGLDDVVVDLRTGEPVVHAREQASTPTNRLVEAPAYQLAFKRAFDVGVAAVTLIFVFPLLLALALAVKLSSPGPVFYSQARVGRDGKEFMFRKFRSMYVDADARKAQLAHLNEAEGPIFKMRRDPRVTPVGRWLRRMSLDELPQLFHVLAGQMSLVGPRPHLPEEVEEYGPLDYRRLTVQPGITCIWQVSGRSELDFDTWVALDLEYIDTWSVWLDLKLMFKTIPAVLSGRGAY